MQIGIGGASSDNYDKLRRFLPDPALGPHDPTTAVQLAGLYLLKFAGAPTGQPIDAYRAAILDYNHDPAYVDRVLADAHAYEGAGTAAVGAACSAGWGTPLVPGVRARILASGDAAAPADAPAAVQEMIAAGNRIDRFPYSYAGGHGAVRQTMNQGTPNPAAFSGAQENGGPGCDCSSATDYVLYGGGFGQTLLQDSAPASTTLESVGDPGPGKWVTIYANPDHAYIEVAGIYFDTAAGLGNAPNAVYRPAVEHRRDRPHRVRRAASTGTLTSETASIRFGRASAKLLAEERRAARQTAWAMAAASLRRAR